MALDYYDPSVGPDPTEWLATDEQERMDLVTGYHFDTNDYSPSDHAHASIHTIVETQVAANDPPETRKALDRLLAGGLDRHEAIHAVGTVVSELMFDILENETPYDDAKDHNFRQALNGLTEQSWRDKYPPPKRPRKRWKFKRRIRT